MAGAGAIGQWLGALLLRDGHDVTLLTREAHARAIQSQGLSIRGETVLTGHLPCITRAADAAGRGGFDLIAVTAKAHATAAVARETAPLLAARGTMLTLQNGLGNAQKLCAFVPPAQVAVALTSHGVDLEAPGRLHHAGTGPTVVGPAPGAGEAAPAARTAHAVLDRAGLQPEWQPDMRGPAWRKAIANHAINPVAALARVRNGRLLDGALRERSRLLCDEGFALTRAAGVALPDAAGSAQRLWEGVEATLRRTQDNRCSMLQDVEARRPTEAEQISGRMVRLARRLGYPMPASEVAYREAKALEAGYLGAEAAARLTRDEVAWEAAPF